MQTLLIIFTAFLFLNIVSSVILAYKEELISFIFFREESRLLRIIERHADEFDRLIFYNKGCLCVGHRRLKRLFVVIWVKKDAELSFSLHTSLTNCLLTNIESRQNHRIAKTVFTVLWKKYLLAQEYLMDIDEADLLKEN